MHKFTIILLALFSLSAFSQSDVFDVARKGTIEEMKMLVSKDANVVNLVNADGNSALILACYRGNVEVAKFLVSSIKDINYVSSMGTALMAATFKGQEIIVQNLLENNSNPNITDSNGTSALIYATMIKSNKIISLLLKYKADKNHKDNQGKKAIDFAILDNDKQLIELLKN